ncbi:MAG: hypothetical protein ACK6DZ_00510, partial [Acidobacteriota bacterium]
QRRRARGNHSGPSRKQFRGGTKTIRVPAGIFVRVGPGIVFAFTPERFSPSPRNPVRFGPESPDGFNGTNLDAGSDRFRLDLAKGIVFPKLVHSERAEVDRHQVQRVRVLAFHIGRRVGQLSAEEFPHDGAALDISWGRCSVCERLSLCLNW